ncbi:MAG: hypothetical protein ACLTTU_04560 [Bilophila wadsworthia]
MNANKPCGKAAAALKHCLLPMAALLTALAALLPIPLRQVNPCAYA